MRDGGKVLASQDVTLKGDGAAAERDRGVQRAATPGRSRSRSRSIRSPGEENTDNNRVIAAGERENAQAAHPVFRGRAALGVQVHPPRAGDDYNDYRAGIHGAHHAEQDLTQSPPSTDKDKAVWKTAFRPKPRSCSTSQGLIIGSVEANYFTPAQQQLIHDFVDRRGGGLLFIGGRARCRDGGWPNSPLADLIPTQAAGAQGTRSIAISPAVELTPQGAQSVICRLDDDPARNDEKWKKMPQMANYQEVGRGQAGRDGAAAIDAAGQAHSRCWSTENYGRGRTVLFATEGSWRWKMWLDHADKTHATFWQQMFRHLVTDTPGQVIATRRSRCCPTRRACRFASKFATSSSSR